MEYKQEFSHMDKHFDHNISAGNLHQVSADLYSHDQANVGGLGQNHGHLISHENLVQQGIPQATSLQSQFIPVNTSAGAIHGYSQGAQHLQGFQQPMNSFIMGQAQPQVFQSTQQQFVSQPQFVQQGFSGLDQQLIMNDHGQQPVGYIMGEPMLQNNFGGQSIIPQQHINFGGEQQFGGQLVYQGQPEQIILPSQPSFSNYQIVSQQPQQLIYGDQIQYQGIQHAQAPSYQPLPGQSFIGGGISNSFSGGNLQVLQGQPQFIGESPLQIQGGAPLRASFSNNGFAQQGGIIGQPLRGSFANHSIQPSIGAFPIASAGIQGQPQPSFLPTTQFGAGSYPFDNQPALRASLGGQPLQSGFQGTNLPTFSSQYAGISGQPQIQPQIQSHLGSQFGGPQIGQPQLQPHLGSQLGPQLGQQSFGQAHAQPGQTQFQPISSQFPQPQSSSPFGGHQQNPTQTSTEGVSLNRNREYDSLSKKR